MTPRGFLDASADPEVVAGWWRRWPEALIGVPTGERSGIVVLDLDAPGDTHQADGVAGFAAVQGDRSLPPHPVIRTRSGGEHHYFSATTARTVRNRASKIAPGVDQRGQGGYVVVPPSPGYTRVSDVWPPPLPPAWLLDLMAPPPAPVRRYVGVPKPMRSFAALVRFAATATEGERNQRVYWAACRIGQAVAQGHIGQAAAIAMIAHAGQHAGLSEREATATAASGVEMGRGNR